MSSAMASLSSVAHISSSAVQHQQQRRSSSNRRAVQVQAFFGRKKAVVEAPPPPPPKPQSRLSSLFGSRNAPDSSTSTSTSSKKPQQQKSLPPPAAKAKAAAAPAKPSAKAAVASKSSKSGKSDSGVDKAAEYKRRQGLFGGVMGALDFSEVRSTSDAELLYDAKYGKLVNGKLSPEQARALRRRVGGTAKDYWKDWVEVKGSYTDKGYVERDGASTASAVPALPFLVAVVVGLFATTATLFIK